MAKMSIAGAMYVGLVFGAGFVFAAMPLLVGRRLAGACAADGGGG